MSAANLTQAAGQAYDKIDTQFSIGAMKTHLAAFCTNLLPTFPEQDAHSRPIANWLSVIDAFAKNLPSSSSDQTIADLTAAGLYMYKCLYLGAALQTSSQISAAQATALLAQFNAQFP